MIEHKTMAPSQGWTRCVQTFNDIYQVIVLNPLFHGNSCENFWERSHHNKLSQN